MCYQMILLVKVKCYQTKQITMILLTQENNNCQYRTQKSTDIYPDTTATASTLHEATNTTSKDLSAVMPSSEDVGTKKGNNIMTSTTNKNNNEVSLDTTTEMLPDETMRPSNPLPDATIQNKLQTLENINSTTHERKETEQLDLDSQEPAKLLDIEWQEEITTDLKENTEIDKTREIVLILQ